MGRFTILLQDGSQTILAVVKDVKGRRRKLIFAVILALIVLGAGAFGIFRYLSTSAEERVADAFSSLSACMVGQPLPEGDKPSLQFRALQLSAMTQVDKKRSEAKSKKEEPWPDRCGPLAHAFHEALQDAGKAQPGEKDLAHWVEQLASQLKEEGAYAADVSEALDQIWQLAHQAGLAAKARSDVAAPPQPSAAPSLDSLPATARVTPKAFDLKSLRPEVHPGRSARFLVEDKDQDRSPFICTFPDGEGSGQCASLPKPLTEATHAGFFLLGTAADAAAPLVFGGDRGGDGAYRSDTGTPVADGGAFAGHVAADGFASVLAWNAAKTGLVLVRGSGEEIKAQPVSTAAFRLRSDDLEQDAMVLYNQLLLRGKNSFDETWIAAAPIESGPVMLGTVQNVGRLADPTGQQPTPKGWPQLTGCRTGEAIVLRARHGQQEFLSFAVDDRWTKPVKVPSVGGALSCRKTEATITRIDPGSAGTPLETTITQHRCTPAACQSESVSMKKLLAGEQGLVPSAVVAAAGLDGKLLVLWGAGSRGGVRMRLAPASRIAQAEDVVVFDDLIKDGAVQTTSALFDARVVARESFALALLSTAAGLYALRIGADGSVAPVDVNWPK